MFLNKNPRKDLILFLFKTLSWIIGLNILFTSIFKIFKEEFNKNNLESVSDLKIKKLNYDQNVQFKRYIY